MSNSIKELDADFVIVYNDKKDELSLAKLIDFLYDTGFYAQVRDLDENSILIFIKLSSYKFKELYQKDQMRNYEFGITASIDSRADKLRIEYEYLSGNTSDDLNLDAHKHIGSITPITKSISDTSAFDDVKHHLLLLKNPTSSFLRDNFGSHVALYFEFAKHFIVWLCGLSVLGLVSYFKSKHLFSLTYCVLNLIWGTLFLAFWNKRLLYLVNFWGVANTHLIREHQQEVVAINENFEEKSSFVNKGNDSGVRFVKQLMFIPAALGFAAVLIAYQLGCFVLEIFINEIWDGPYKGVIALVPTVLISVFVPILTIIFNKVLDIMIKIENHNNLYTKTNSVLVKQFVLNFLTSYMPLIITAFIYLPFAHLIEPNLVNIQYSLARNLNSSSFYYKYLNHIKTQKDFSMNQERLNVQFFYFTVTNQVVQLVMKYGLPQIISLVSGLLSKSTYEPKDQSNEVDYLQSVRKYVKLPDYNVNDDFRFITIVYGYLILFGPVWSLAPLVTLVFLSLTLKLDYLKLLNGKYFKPPIPHRADSIFPWNYALFLLTWLGSVISPAITAFYHHGDKPPKTLGQFSLDSASINVSSSHLVIILLLTEHGFLVVWYALNRIFSLFKTEVEWKNDFTDNDIKFRRDYFSSNVKLDEKLFDDGEWGLITSKTTYDQYNRIVTGEGAEQPEPEVIPQATLTGVDTGKQFIPDEKEVDLEDVKHETDDIIQVPSEDKPVAATIDDNSHIPQEGGEYQKDYEKEATPEQSGAPEKKQSSSSESVESSSKSDSKKKRSPLKKLLKKK